MTRKTDSPLGVVADVQRMLEQMPGTADIFDGLRTGKIAPDEAMVKLAQAAMANGQSEALIQASSKLTDMLNVTTTETEDGVPVVMKHDNGMDMVNPVLEAALKERASLDGDVPEARIGPIAEGGRPAVPVLTDALDPVVVGYQLEQAAAQVEQELQRAVEDHGTMCSQLLADIAQFAPEDQRETALEVAKKHLPAPPDGVDGYQAGQKAELRKAVEPPTTELATLSPEKRRAYTYQSLATTQGRVSLTPAIEAAVVERLVSKGLDAVTGEPDPDDAVTTKWVTVVWGAEDLTDGFDPVTAAINSMCADLVEHLPHNPSPWVVRVSPYNGIADRRFGWVVVASPKEISS